MRGEGAMRSAVLGAAGLARADIESWAQSEPRDTADYAGDRRRFGRFWSQGEALLARLPAKASRAPAEAEAAALLLEAMRGARSRFLAAHARTLYDQLTRERTRFLRLEELVFDAAEAVPGLVPSRDRLAAEADLLQRDKDGAEIDQGLLLSAILADEAAGTHLCHAMLLPRPESAELLTRFAAEGELDLGPARVERKGRAVQVTMRNPRFLNAEDETTLDLTEAAVDVAILDPGSDIAVLRGDVVEHPKYRGRRILGAGINLTHLYRGRIPFVWFLQRDMGYLHKIFRGVARGDCVPDDIHGSATEKPWIAAVETFAIGGHCQLLLVMDYVIAASDAYITLPARKEGIIPGFANLRLPRFTGDRLARQLIQYERRLECASAEGRLICDEIAAAQDMEVVIERAVEGLASSGAVGAIGNRRAFRVAHEPLDVFRRYAALYAREQAYCHYSPALIANLERHWRAQERRL